MLNMISLLRTKKVLPVAGTLCLLILIVVGLGYSGFRRLASDTSAVVVGEMAPDFTLPDLHGQQVSLNQFRGQKVLLAFWASWCPPCQTEMTSLQQLHENPAVRNLNILAINVGETQEQAVAFVVRQQLSLPILFDATDAAQIGYGVRQLPVVFLVNGQGRIIARHLGLRDWNSSDVIAEINQLGGE